MRIAPNTRSPARTQGEISCRITTPRSSTALVLDARSRSRSRCDLRAQERLIPSSAPPRADAKPGWTRLERRRPDPPPAARGAGPPDRRRPARNRRLSPRAARAERGRAPHRELIQGVGLVGTSSKGSSSSGLARTLAGNDGSASVRREPPCRSGSAEEHVLSSGVVPVAGWRGESARAPWHPIAPLRTEGSSTAG